MKKAKAVVVSKKVRTVINQNFIDLTQLCEELADKAIILNKRLHVVESFIGRCASCVKKDIGELTAIRNAQEIFENSTAFTTLCPKITLELIKPILSYLNQRKQGEK